MRKKFFSFFHLLSFFFVFFVALPWKALFSQGELSVHFFDVGQGDAIYVRTSGSEDLLIDGGPDHSLIHQLGRAMPFWDRTIEYLILTHPQADHMTGLIDVFERYHVRHFYHNGIPSRLPEYEALMEEVYRKGSQQHIIRHPQAIDLSGAARMEFLYPLELRRDQEIELNHTALVTKLIDQGKTFLFTGDIEREDEEALMTSGIFLQADVLKVAHHGSKTSSIRRFLLAVQPVVAVIQTGEENKYGHPHQEVLRRLSEIYAVVYRNDWHGEVVVSVEDGKLDVETIEY
jgi:competence protein ComEC